MLVIIMPNVVVTYLKGAVGNVRASVAFLTSTQCQLKPLYGGGDSNWLGSHW